MGGSFSIHTVHMVDVGGCVSSCTYCIIRTYNRYQSDFHSCIHAKYNNGNINENENIFHETGSILWFVYRVDAHNSMFSVLHACVSGVLFEI